jgi:ankyrin repeat protein
MAVALLLLCTGAAVLASRPRLPALQARVELWRRGFPAGDPAAVLTASRNDDVETLALLHRAGVPLDVVGSEGETAVHVAAVADARQAITFLLERGVSPDAGAVTPLARALEAGHAEMARMLLARGADANAAMGPERQPALVYAARTGDAGMLRLLLDNHADPDVVGTDGLTAIAHAAARDDGAMTRTLLTAGATPDVTPVGGARSLLEAAIRDGDLTRVNLLLARGADPSGTTSSGQPVLLLAVALGDHEITTALLDAGAYLETTAVAPVSDEFLELVPNAHAKFYLTKDEGVTALMLAVLRGDIGMARLLLARGASVGPTTGRFKYPLGMAANRGDIRMMQVLLGRDPEEAARTRRLVVSLSEQQARLHENDELAYETRVSTGRKGFRTPAGEYVITDKKRKWRSTLYDVDMPYFMRLSGSEIGLHQGNVPPYPASHGCIRLPAEAARTLFARMKLGDLVTIAP